MAVSANRLELLQIADAVAREKSIDRVIVIEAMQDAMEKAAKGRYGAYDAVSLGTLVGLPMAHRRPDLFSAYVGTDFYVDMLENERVGVRA